METNTDSPFPGFIEEMNKFKARQRREYARGIILTIIPIYTFISILLKDYYNLPINGFVPALLLMLIVALPLLKLNTWMGKIIDEKQYVVKIISQNLNTTADIPHISSDVLISINLSQKQKKQLAITHWCNIIIHVVAIISIIIGVIFLISNLPPAPLVHKILFFVLLFTTIIVVKIYYTIILGFIRFLIVYL